MLTEKITKLLVDLKKEAEDQVRSGQLTIVDLETIEAALAVVELEFRGRR